MITTGGIWHGLHVLAKSRGVSLYRLAKNAGVDASIFSATKQQRLGWVSLRTLATVLNSCGVSLSEFEKMMEA